MATKHVVLGAALALASLAVQAQSYRCVGKDGKKYYGLDVPPQCAGMLVEQVSAQGNVLRRIDPQASGDDRAKREAAEAERRKLAAISKEQARRDQALLATYASEKDIEDMRRRALESDQRVVKELEGKIGALKERRAAGKQDPKTADVELQVQENLLATKKKDVAAINAKYDDDKKRYLDLTRRDK
jgi:hypothetical protein